MSLKTKTLDDPQKTDNKDIWNPVRIFKVSIYNKII